MPQSPPQIEDRRTQEDKSQNRGNNDSNTDATWLLLLLAFYAKLNKFTIFHVGLFSYYATQQSEHATSNKVKIQD